MDRGRKALDLLRDPDSKASANGVNVSQAGANQLLAQLRSHEERELVDKLREIGLDRYIELPQVAVMGDTSSGKSSLLSALSGVSFPSSDQLTTRCPTQLILSRSPTFRGNVRLLRFHRGGMTVDGARGGDDVKEPVEEPNDDPEEILCMADVPGAIEKLTQKLVDEGHYISDDQIVIEISGPDLPNLTLTDLPGLVRTVGDRESHSMIQRVREMVERYMGQERTIIVAVVPANVDMHNMEILQVAQEVDPSGFRTIAVVTKMDLVDAGAETAVHELLLNKKKHMRLGYHAVKCRNQRDLNMGTTIQKGLDDEVEFFGGHEYWHCLSTHQWGVPNLSKRLVSILQDNIRRSLPKVITEIDELMKGVEAELGDMGAALNSLGVQREQFCKWADQYIRHMEAAINGKYELLSLDRHRGSSGSTAETNMRLRAVLHQKDLVFREGVEAATSDDTFGLETLAPTEVKDEAKLSKPQEDVAVGDDVAVEDEKKGTIFCQVMDTRNTDIRCSELPDEWVGASRWRFAFNERGTARATLKRFIQANRGDELTIFPSYQVFCRCVQESACKWKQPAAQLLEHYHSQTRAVSQCAVAAVVGDAGSIGDAGNAVNARVVRFFNATAEKILRDLRVTAQRELEGLLTHETRPYTQDPGLYNELDRLRQEALRARLEAALEPKNEYGLVSLDDVTRLLGDGISGPFEEDAGDREVLEMELALRAYLKVATHRFVDVVPMKLNDVVLKSFLSKMERELRGSMTDYMVAKLLREPEERASRRQQLNEQARTLKSARDFIEGGDCY